MVTSRSERGIWAKSIAWAILSIFAAVVLFAEFLAPYDEASQVRSTPSAPASSIRFRDESDRLHFRPFIYKIELTDALNGVYAEDRSQGYPIGLFEEGEPYKLLGLFQSQTHLFGVIGDGGAPPRVHLLGTDALGRDRFSRLLIAAKFSLIVTPLGALLAFMIGAMVGLMSGYSGRTVDTVIMGITDTVMALPTLILILAARAAFPLDLPPTRAAMLLVMIFAFTGWAEIARLTRGLVRSIKEREFILAARSIGLSESRILFRHILPNAAGPLMTQLTVILPYFLLSEVALSFLGVGVQEPQPSLGNMLAAAADISQLQRSPLLMLSPAIVIFLFVIAIRTVADGRDD